MHRLLPLALLAFAALTGCLAEGHETHDVVVQWATENPPTDHIGTARIWYPGDTIETRGYSGSTLVVLESSSPEIEICVQLGTYEIVEDESTPCQIAGCEPAPEFVTMTDRQCALVRVDQPNVEPTVSFTF